MCQFLSAIVLRNGDIICDPEHTDSHEDLVDASGLSDRGLDGFVRVEFTSDTKSKPETYVLKVDQASTPEWFKEYRQRVDDDLRARIRRMIVDDERKILLGGCWIVCGNAKVCVSKSRIIEVESGTVEEIRGGTVKAIRGGTVKAISGGTVEAIWGGTVKAISGGTVEAIRGGTVEAIWGGTVKAIRGGTVEEIWGGTVEEIWGGTVEAIWGGTVKAIWGGTVKAIRGGTVINDLRPKGTK